MTTTPPGWYDDGHGALRWWDGAQWTDHIATPDEAPAADPAPGEEAPADITADEGETAVLPPELADAFAGPADGIQSPAPEGYPGAGHPGSAGAFVAATEPRSSKLWIVWVVLGVVLLGIVAALAVLIPMLFLSAASEGPTSQPSATVYSQAEQDQAVAAVKLYDQAYQDNDCDAYFASTTEAFRDLIGITDCETFNANAADFATAFTDYEVTVTSVEQNGETLSVFTTETYLSVFDEDGNQLDTPELFEDHYEYTVVPTDDGWAIDDAYVN